MTLFARVSTAVVFTAALAVGPAAMPSAADDGPERPARRPAARLVLTLAPSGGALEASEAGPAAGARRVILTCGPDGGTHPSPAAACDSLRRVGGAFERLPDVPDMFCPAVYDPHVARASGYWSATPGGPARLVNYEETFGNRCEAAVGTDDVFGF